MAKVASKSLTVTREDDEDMQILGIVIKTGGEIYFKVARKITLTMKDVKEIVIIMNKLYAEEE